ncbi:MAG: hypothetical protein WDM88_13660 [Galbitalea sp.]
MDYGKQRVHEQREGRDQDRASRHLHEIALREATGDESSETHLP